jgi:hypothetical protein
VLAGLDTADDRSAKPESGPARRFCDTASSLARSSDSIHSSAVGVDGVADDVLGSSKV